MTINNEESYNPQQFTISLSAEWWSVICWGDLLLPYLLPVPLQLNTWWRGVCFQGKQTAPEGRSQILTTQAAGSTKATCACAYSTEPHFAASNQGST